MLKRTTLIKESAVGGPGWKQGTSWVVSQQDIEARYNGGWHQVASSKVMRDGWRQPRNCLTPEVHCFLKFTDHQIHPVHVSIHIRGVTDPSESVLDRVLLTGVI